MFSVLLLHLKYTHCQLKAGHKIITRAFVLEGLVFLNPVNIVKSICLEYVLWIILLFFMLNIHFFVFKCSPQIRTCVQMV